MTETLIRPTGWENADEFPIAGDASSRTYTRLVRAGTSAILMRSNGTPTEPFVRIAQLFRSAGLSAPEILDRSTDTLLIEDFGDGILARLIKTDENLERPLYEAATDLIVAFQSIPLSGDLSHYNPQQMAEALDPFFVHYAHRRDDDLVRRLADLLAAHDAPPVFCHRDYHAENLVWLPKRNAVARIGILDFQDAVAAHPAYDLASLLQDARRDVPITLETDMIARFCDATGVSEGEFRGAYALQSAQRHLRILGIFKRLASERNKPGYLALIPRVRAYLDRCLTHSAAASLREPLSALMP